MQTVLIFPHFANVSYFADAMAAIRSSISLLSSACSWSCSSSTLAFAASLHFRPVSSFSLGTASPSCRQRTVTMTAETGKGTAQGTDPKRPFGVLFVCLGNICRSPTAEAVFRYLVEKRGLGAQFNIDSAGTIDYHEGDPADARMKAAAIRRGIMLTSLSRPIQPSDFDKFDLIIAMDKKNKADILKAYTIWNSNQPYSFDGRNKVKLMCSYCKKNKEMEVPDPYYGGPAGFEKVLDLLDDACEGLLDSILAEHLVDKTTAQ